MRLTAPFFPLDQDGRTQRRRLLSVFPEAQVAAAAESIAKEETALYSAFQEVQETIVSDRLSDYDVVTIGRTMRLNIARDAAHDFRLACHRALRGRAIFASCIQLDDGVHRLLGYAKQAGIRLHETEIEEFFARVH